MDGFIISLATLLLTTVISLFVAILINVMVKALLWYSKAKSIQHEKLAVQKITTDDDDVAVAIAAALLARSK